MPKEVINVSIHNIIPNRFQPRVEFNNDNLNELVQSIKQYGIIQPLILRKISDKYEIIAGERRYKAAVLAGFSEVPAIITALDDNSSATLALTENIQRQELNPLEKAKSYQNLINLNQITTSQLATRLGISEDDINSKLKLLTLSNEVQVALTKNAISERHARSLLMLDNQSSQNQVLNDIINKRLTVKQTDDMIKQMVENNLSTVPITSTNPFANLSTPQNDSISISSLNSDNTNQNVQSALNSIDLVNTKDKIFNDTEETIADKQLFKSYPSLESESANMDMNNLTSSPTPLVSSPQPSVSEPIITPPIANDFNNQVNSYNPHTAPIPTLNNTDSVPVSPAIVSETLQPTIPTPPTSPFYQQTVGGNEPKEPNLYNQFFGSNDLFPDLNFTTVEEEKKKEEQRFVPIDNFAKVKENVSTIRNFFKQLDVVKNNIDVEEFDLKKEYQFIIKLPKE